DDIFSADESYLCQTRLTLLTLLPHLAGQASRFLTLGRSCMRLKCAATFGKPDMLISNKVARRQHQKKRASGAMKWLKTLGGFCKRIVERCSAEFHSLRI